MVPHYERALIVGAGEGLSASLAQVFAKAGLRVGLAARNTAKLAAIAKDTKADVFAADAASPSAVDQLFADIEMKWQASPDVVVYNAGYRTRGPFAGLDVKEVEKTLAVTAFGGFLVAQAAVKRMLPHKHGAVLFTGASASVKGYAQSAPFAMGKFALRGLAQSMARELHPQGIHIGHFVVDGGIGQPGGKSGEAMLDPDAMAETYLHFLKQDRSIWSWEIEIRPMVEKF